MSGSTERADVQALAQRVLSSTVNAPADRDAAVLADAYLRLAAALRAAEEESHERATIIGLLEEKLQAAEEALAEIAKPQRFRTSKGALRHVQYVARAALAAASTEGAGE